MEEGEEMRGGGALMSRIRSYAGLVDRMRSRTVASRFALFVIVLCTFILSSGQSTSAHIGSLVPNATTAGASAFTLRILGTDFDQSDTEHLLFRGQRVPGTLISSQELQATIPQSLIAVPGIAIVQLEDFNSATFVINPPLQIVTAASLPDAVPGQAYSQRLEVSGGTPPFGWSGSVPAGFGLSLTASGVVQGTAIPVETAFGFPETVTDAASAGASRNFELRVRYPCSGPCLLVEDAQVTEGDTGTVDAQVRIRLGAPAANPITVNFETQSFSAT